MTEEENKQHWKQLITTVIITFVVSFLAFYIVMEIMLHRINNPMFNINKMEKILQKQNKEFRRFENNFDENPFEPRMRPMLVNLVKESDEYKIIVNLRALDNDENNVNIDIQGDEITILGKMDKKSNGHEKIINFTQTYYLDEKIESDKIFKEKRGDKYIITIPFKTDNDNEESEDDD